MGKVLAYYVKLLNENYFETFSTGLHSIIPEYVFDHPTCTYTIAFPRRKPNRFTDFHAITTVRIYIARSWWWSRPMSG